MSLLGNTCSGMGLFVRSKRDRNSGGSVWLLSCSASLVLDSHKSVVYANLQLLRLSSCLFLVFSSSCSCSKSSLKKHIVLCQPILSCVGCGPISQLFPIALIHWIASIQINMQCKTANTCNNNSTREESKSLFGIQLYTH